MNVFDLNKKKWTENDFEQMNWHDNKIYAISFDGETYEISFDIDYILKWIEPERNETNFKFLIMPATLVFRNVYNLNMSFSLVDITIDNISRDNPTTPKNIAYTGGQIEYTWIIETTSGEIVFKSVGYEQYARKKPQLYSDQSIGLLERGGIAFDKLAF